MHNEVNASLYALLAPTFKQGSSPWYVPKRSQVIKNKRRRAHLQRTARK